jgi:redox-sensing transcriptional repressor
MQYYRFLSDTAGKKVPPTVTSAEIAAALDLDPTQVRKDFGAIGLQGLGRVGFERCEICRAIRFELGFDETYEAVLVGAGNLGTALLAYAGFERYGLKIVAAFDNEPRIIGRRVKGLTVQSTRVLKSYVKKNGIHMAILTTPASVAQTVADRVVDVGVTAIWNFAPTNLTVPPKVFVRNHHLSLGLSELAYHLKKRRPEDD